MPGREHNRLCRLGVRLLRAEGFSCAFEGDSLDWGRTGERPDVIGWAEQEVPVATWCPDGGSIGRHESAVIECKATRADFLANREKAYAAWMGDWRVWLCPPGIITPDDLVTGDGLYWAVGGGLDEEAPPESWALKQAPLRRNGSAKSRETATLLRSLDRAVNRPREQDAAGGAARGVAGTPAAGAAERRLSWEARAVAAELRTEEGMEAKVADLLRIAKRANPKLKASKASPGKIERELIAAGFPSEPVDGVNLFRAKGDG